MSKILIVSAASAFISGCAAVGVDTNADPFAMSATSAKVNGADLGGVVPRAAFASAKIARPITAARTAPSHNAVPTYYVEKSCKTGSPTDNNSYESCLQQESAAKDDLTKAWKGYSAVARNECAPATGDPTNSYVALITCFEMLDWMKEPGSIGGVTGTGGMHAKSVMDAAPGQDGGSPEQASGQDGGSPEQASSTEETPKVPQP
jgi:hypothetical protein